MSKKTRLSTELTILPVRYAKREKESGEAASQVLPGNAPGSFVALFDGLEKKWRGRKTITLPAGVIGTWVFRYCHRGQPIKAGGGLVIEDKGIPIVRFPQTEYSGRMEYAVWEVKSRAETEVVLRESYGMLRDPAVILRVVSGEFKEGDAVTFRFGERSSGGAGTCVYDIVAEGTINAGVDRTGSGVFRALKNMPLRVRVESREDAAAYRVILPSIVTPGEKFPVTVTAWDVFRNLCRKAEARIELDVPHGMRGIGKRIDLTRKHAGVVTLRRVSFTSPGVFRIGFRDRERRIAGWSNPILVTRERRDRIYWGDLHCHAFGDRSGLLCEKRDRLDPVKCYCMIRRISRLDFAALSSMNIPVRQESVWREYRAACRKSGSGRFVPFLAKEFHCRPGGDRQVFWRGDSGVPLDTWVSARELYGRYGKRKDMMIECHVGGGAADWDSFSPVDEAMLEIASGHGNFEWFLQEALRRGFHPTVIGASDAHHDMPGGPRGLKENRGRFMRKNAVLRFRDHGFHAGPLAAVYAPVLNGEALFESFTQRKTYATTGARILLFFHVNGADMGSQLTVDNPPELDVTVHGTERIEHVDIIRGDRLLARRKGEGPDFKLAMKDASLPNGPWTWYYVRVRQVDGEYAWSTPIWVRNTGRASARVRNLPRWDQVRPRAFRAPAARKMKMYMDKLKQFLRKEGIPGRISQIRPVGVVNESVGNAAVFSAYAEPEHFPITIRYYFEFDMPAIHFDFGREDFGVTDTLTRPVTG